MGSFKEILGNVFKNLGVEFYSSAMLLENGFIKMEVKKEEREKDVL
jgi:hypothetical protein